MAKYKSKSSIVDAIQFTGSNWEAFTDFIDIPYMTLTKTQQLIIPTAEYVNEGDWIIKLTDQKFQVCASDSFEQAYEPV